MTDTMSELVEKLADLEHKQWMSWAKAIMETENISPERKERWQKLMVDYEQLPEDMKEHDRKWAKEVIGVFFGQMIKDEQERWQK